MKYSTEAFHKIWLIYLLYIKRKVFSSQDYAVKDIVYWQNELFVKTIAFTLPVSCVVIIPSMLMSFKEGSVWIPAIEVLTLASISLFILCTRFAVKIKMLFSVGVLVLFAVFLIAAMGSFGIGSLYLLAVSVLISLLFSSRVAYLSLFLNLFIYVGFAFVIYFKIFKWPIVNHYKIEVWLTYSLNFVFLNLLVALEIRHILGGLQTTINNEEKLLKDLHSELEIKNERNLLLAESEGHYKSLFFNNPSPMWIFNANTMHFLQVNDAAVKKYEYSTAEFASMTIDQIGVGRLPFVSGDIESALNAKTVFSNVALHEKKSGKQFYAKISCSTIPFQGQQALLVIVQDITTEISRNQAIEKQNDKLKDIAYMQSHTIRAPLARIKGLWELFEFDSSISPDRQLFSYMKSSIEELDQVIWKITKDSEPVRPGSQAEKVDDEN